MSILQTILKTRSFTISVPVVTPPASEDMILVWDADINSTATLPLISGGSWWSYEGTTDVTVDWGDGTVESFNTPDYRTHTYSTGGEKTITISGTLTHYGDADFNYGSETYNGLVRVESFGNLGLVKLDSAFIYTTNLTELPSVLPSTVTLINWLVYDSAYNGTEVTNWDTSNVTNMQGTFSGFDLGVFNQDIGSWDVSNVTDMSYMFNRAYNFNQDIGSWDVGNVTNMDGMFVSNIDFNQDLSGWCVVNIPSEPGGGWYAESAWTLPQPVWGLCGEYKIVNSDVDVVFPAEPITGYYGTSSAIDGDYVVVGAYLANSTGNAYVFNKSGSTWIEQQKLTASDAENTDYFGNSVAIDGDTIVVGAPLEAGAGSQRGAAYVYTRSGSTWTEQQKITASDAANSDRFGWSVDISGDTIVVGAYQEEETGTNRGSVYVFTRSAGVWTQQQKLIASDAADNDNFGISVAIDGDSIVVGSYRDDYGVGSDKGSAYVFTRSAGVWSEQQKLTASDAAATDYFGFSVDIDGDNIAVGANLEDGAGTDRGAVYVFTRSAGVWTEQQKVVPIIAINNWKFGNAVAINGDTLIVGSSEASSFPGWAYVFTRSAGVWTERTRFRNSDSDDVTDRFGKSVATDGVNVVVGASNKTVATIVNVGAAYIYGLN